jgi:hypothetical protein
MLNAATVTYNGNQILKITISRTNLPQYWKGIKKAINDQYNRGQIYSDHFGREIVMYESQELAVRHIVDWETIERYWKKRLKGMPIQHQDRAQGAEGIVEDRIVALLAILQAYRFRPTDRICQQPVPADVVTDPQTRFTMNLSLMFMLSMNDLSNLFLGDSGHNSGLGAASSQAKLRLKVNYPGKTENKLLQRPDGRLDYGPVTIHKESKQSAVIRLQEHLSGRPSDLRFQEAATARATKMQNKFARFDDGGDSDVNWGVPQPLLQQKREEFEEMWPTAWLAKPGKYGEI